MAAAVVRASYYGASATEPAGVTAETGIKFNREDTQVGTTGPIPIPNAAATNFSWYKQLALEVTTIGTTNITNRTVKQASAPSAGLKLHFKYAATYAQASGANKPADDGTTNDVTPTGYTAMTGTAQGYDAASVSTGSTGRNGGFCLVALGVSYLYTGGAGSAVALPNIELGYDEA